MKTNSIKVSIIVPVYNVEKYIAKCLESLVNQSLKEIEIIVVNDGTPDNSQDIIDIYAKKYPNLIKAYKKKNGGLSDARNYGIKKANGEYIAFVDSDDFVDFDMYEMMYNKAKDTDSDIVYCPISSDWNIKEERNYFKEQINEDNSVLKNPYILYDANSYAWNKIYKRTMWLENKFLFPLGQYFEDSAIIYNVMLMASRINYVNIPFYHYQKGRVDAITMQFNYKMFDIFLSCQNVIDFYKEHLKDEYCHYEKYVEYICQKHIYSRFNFLSKCNDKKLIKNFVNKSFEFLNSNFDNWKNSEISRCSKKSKFKTKFKRYLRRHKTLFIFYKTLPRGLRRFLIHLSKRVLSKKIVVKKESKQKVQKRKRKYIQKNGFEVLVNTQHILDDLNIMNYADFGTLLGLIREKRLLAHDLDMDIGVFASPIEKEIIRATLERHGYELWRKYVFDDRVVEESYKYKGIKLDINYYEIKDGKSITWLFYREPNKKYVNQERNIVEMHYTLISKAKKIKIKGFSINIPTNARTLLKEKYGKEWTIPNKDWIYWKSPAATPIDSIGVYINCNYSNRPIAEKENNYSLIKKVQKTELTVLKTVDKFCRKNDITYYLSEGTLLGAVRHRGFIPWDDDVDIAMPREDYEKFIKLFADKGYKDCYLYNQLTVRGYHLPFSKIYSKKELEFKEGKKRLYFKGLGAFVDVFPLDLVNDYHVDKKVVINAKKIRKYRDMMLVKGPYSVKMNYKKKLYLILSNFYTNENIQQKIYNISTYYNDKNAKFIINYGSSYKYDKQIVPKEYYGKPKYIKFEDIELPVPCESEKILLKIYGNYSLLPPLKKRSIKHMVTSKKQLNEFRKQPNNK